MAGESIKTNKEEHMLGDAQRKHLLSQVTSRIIACAASAVAAVVMAFDRETTVFGNVRMQADYKTVSTFKFFIGGNAAVSAYCLLSLPFVVAHQGKGPLMHVLDLLTMGLSMAAAAAAAAAGYVGKYGDESAGWMAVCGYFPNFCNKAGLAVALSFLGFVGCFLFCLMQPIPSPKRRATGGGDSATIP